MIVQQEKSSAILTNLVVRLYSFNLGTKERSSLEKKLIRTYRKGSGVPGYGGWNVTEVEMPGLD